MSSLITITGASGFIGYHLTKFYLEKNLSVHALIGPNDNIENFKAKFKSSQLLTVNKIDIRNFAELDQTMKPSDVLIHLAGIANFGVTPSKLYDQINVDGVKNIIEICKKKSIGKLIHISSSETILRDQHQKLGEENKLFNLKDLKGPYSISKLKAENLVREYISQAGKAIIIHPTTPIGAHDLTPTPPGELIQMYLEKKLSAYYNAGINFIGIHSLIDGIDLAIKRGKIGENYILGGSNLYLKDFFKSLEEISKIKSPQKKIPYFVAYSSARIIEKTAQLLNKKPIATIEGVASVKYPFFFNTSKAKKELGFEALDINHDLTLAVKFFSQKNKT